MNVCTRVLAALIVGATLVVGAGCDSTTEEPARLRVIHATPGAGDIDFFIDFELFTRSLTFRSASPYLRWDAGLRLLEARPAGSSQGTPVTREVIIDAERTYSFVVTGATSLASLLVLEDDRSTPPAGQARLRVVHAAPDITSLNVVVREAGTSPGVDATLDALGASSALVSLDAGTYAIEARALDGSGGPAPITQSLQAGLRYLVVVTNTQLFTVADG